MQAVEPRLKCQPAIVRPFTILQAAEGPFVFWGHPILHMELALWQLPFVEITMSSNSGQSPPLIYIHMHH